jgi:hypothetical protein
LFSKNQTQTRSDFQNQNWNQNFILKKNCNPGLIKPGKCQLCQN